MNLRVLSFAIPSDLQTELFRKRIGPMGAVAVRSEGRRPSRFGGSSNRQGEQMTVFSRLDAVIWANKRGLDRVWLGAFIAALIGIIATLASSAAALRAFLPF